MSDEIATSFRVPKVGDVIRTAKPMNTSTPNVPAGSHLRIKLLTEAAVEHARHLVASRRWCVEEGGAT